MIPVSGAFNAATPLFGALIAWIIGWDLILEYAVGNMGVAISWSGYFIKLLRSLTGIRLPLWLVTDHATATSLIQMNSPSLSDFSSTVLPVIGGHEISLNIPAMTIVLLLTALLVYGIQGRQGKYGGRHHKISILIFFIAFGAFYINPAEWHPFLPNGFPE
jgi:amino acid transporter